MPLRRAKSSSASSLALYFVYALLKDFNAGLRVIRHRLQRDLCPQTFPEDCGIVNRLPIFGELSL